MKVVIDILDEVYDWHVNGFPDEEDGVRLLDIVKNGTPLSESEDCISRQAVLDYIYNDLGLGDEENGKDAERQMELESSYRYVKSLPPVTSQPKVGHWTTTITPLGKCCICSECGSCPSIEYRFCPYCGTKMQEVKE